MVDFGPGKVDGKTFLYTETGEGNEGLRRKTDSSTPFACITTLAGRSEYRESEMALIFASTVEVLAKIA